MGDMDSGELGVRQNTMLFSLNFFNFEFPSNFS